MFVIGIAGIGSKSESEGVNKQCDGIMKKKAIWMSVQGDLPPVRMRTGRL